METLQLLTKCLLDQCGPSLTESVLAENCLDVVVALDEIVNLGYRESVNSQSLATLLAMESHEEMVQEIIARVSFFPLGSASNSM